MTTSQMTTEPSPFIVRWLPFVRDHLGYSPDLLELAMGTGRHARIACAYGFRVYGVDRDPDRIKQARTGTLKKAHLWVADLELFPLPSNRFDLIICTNYLQRSIWSDLRASIRPGGFVLYETFTQAQLAYETGPRSPDHLLRAGELCREFKSWELFHNCELTTPACVARLVARKRSQPTP